MTEIVVIRRRRKKGGRPPKSITHRHLETLQGRVTPPEWVGPRRRRTLASRRTRRRVTNKV